MVADDVIAKSKIKGIFAFCKKATCVWAETCPRGFIGLPCFWYQNDPY